VHIVGNAMNATPCRAGAACITLRPMLILLVLNYRGVKPGVRASESTVDPQES